MEHLKDLSQMYDFASEKISQYEGKDFILPSEFKLRVKEINSNKITYNDYSAIIETKGNQHGVLNIYMPNQWFYIASYFIDFYKELIKYKRHALKVANKERLKVLGTEALKEEEITAIQSLDLDDESKSNLRKFITDYDWWHGAKTIDRGDFYVSPILTCAALVNASQSFVADLCAFLSDKEDLASSVVLGADATSKNSKTDNKFLVTKSTLQQIYYGAPGTGKSHVINEITQGEHVIRTTFHPDSDYSTFVGAYKPTTEEVVMRDLSGHRIYEGDKELYENKIVYKFVAQAFLQAYVKAWKYFAEAQDGGEPKKQFLVIEEINRGNCAQIFGDLFQLLDRNDYGFSDYPIQADMDMKNYLSEAFRGLKIASAERINAIYNKDVVSKVLSGEELLLPSNLYIWATMNTSDQSLFPIDSAFKRRWDWQYMPISKGHDDKTGAEINWRIQGETNEYDWWSFLEKINEHIDSTTNSEDKKLGFFFCKAKDNVISSETFVGKVIFYLWNDVFKDYGFDDSIFDDVDGSKLSFNKFYSTDSKGMAVVQKDKVERFLDNLGVEKATTISEVNENEEIIESENKEEVIDSKTVIKVNGKQIRYSNSVPYTAIEEYVRLNPNKTAQEVVDAWEPFVKYTTNNWIIVNNERRSNLSERAANYSYKITCGDGNDVWVNKDGWMHHPKKGLRDTIEEFIQGVNAAELGITITEESI